MRGTDSNSIQLTWFDFNEKNARDLIRNDSNELDRIEATSIEKNGRRFTLMELISYE